MPASVTAVPTGNKKSSLDGIRSILRKRQGQLKLGSLDTTATGSALTNEVTQNLPKPITFSTAKSRLIPQAQFIPGHRVPVDVEDDVGAKPLFQNREDIRMDEPQSINSASPVTSVSRLPGQTTKNTEKVTSDEEVDFLLGHQSGKNSAVYRKSLSPEDDEESLDLSYPEVSSSLGESVTSVL